MSSSEDDSYPLLDRMERSYPRTTMALLIILAIFFFLFWVGVVALVYRGVNIE